MRTPVQVGQYRENVDGQEYVIRNIRGLTSPYRAIEIEYCKSDRVRDEIPEYKVLLDPLLLHPLYRTKVSTGPTWKDL